MKLAIYIAKGGEGKSTTVQNLAVAFARAAETWRSMRKHLREKERRNPRAA